MTGTRTIAELYGAVPYAYLTTTGRRTGAPREVEIWFVARGDTIYLLNGGDGMHAPGSAGWVHNLRANPRATVRIADAAFDVTARFPEPGSAEDDAGRAATFAKHQADYANDLATWRDTGLLVALDLATA